MSLQEVYNSLKAGIEEIQKKIIELEDEADQHRKVLDLLEKTDGERKSMQMIGSVLVEKKVKDVIPAVKETLNGLEKAVSTLKEESRTKIAGFEKWKQENKIKVVKN